MISIYFIYVYVGYQCVLFCFRLWDISVFCFVYVCGISVYFALFTVMWDSSVFCFVYGYVG